MSNRRFRRNVTTVIAVLGVAIAGLAFASPSATADVSTQGGWPVLVRGSSGNNVKTLQNLLRCVREDQSLTADGWYGAATERYVKLYQQENALAVDGKVGGKTWYSITGKEKAEVHGDDESDCVIGAEIQLVKHGARIPVDGKFEPADIEATKQFQESVGLEQSGTVEKMTWHELIST